MGLIAPITTSNVGMPFDEAYCKIERIEANKTVITVQVTYFATEAARLENRSPVAGSLHRIPTEDIVGPIFPSVYDWLKANVDSLTSATDA